MAFKTVKKVMKMIFCANVLMIILKLKISILHLYRIPSTDIQKNKNRFFSLFFVHNGCFNENK